MAETDAGTTIWRKDVQPSNALVPIDTTESGIVISCKEVHSKNAPSPIFQGQIYKINCLYAKKLPSIFSEIDGNFHFVIITLIPQHFDLTLFISS
jgi:hypothetical protein